MAENNRTGAPFDLELNTTGVPLKSLGAWNQNLARLNDEAMAKGVYDPDGAVEDAGGIVSYTSGLLTNTRIVALKRITLWTGELNVNGTITLPTGLANYFPNLWFQMRSGNAVAGYWNGTSISFGCTVGNVAQTCCTYQGTLDYNNMTGAAKLASCSYMYHLPSGQHTAATNSPLTGIFTYGYEVPIIPAAP